MTGYDTGMIPMLLAVIRVKQAIDFMPMFVKKEDLLDRKSEDFFNLPTEYQREELISEQRSILFLLNFNNEYIMDLTKKEFENDNFNVEPEPHRYTKKHY